MIRQLQSVLNAAARLNYRLRSRAHITYALSLHWLWVPERIQHKVQRLVTSRFLMRYINTLYVCINEYVRWLF